MLLVVWVAVMLSMVVEHVVRPLAQLLVVKYEAVKRILDELPAYQS